jgi:hypothetical protein
VTGPTISIIGSSSAIAHAYLRELDGDGRPAAAG